MTDTFYIKPDEATVEAPQVLVRKEFLDTVADNNIRPTAIISAIAGLQRLQEVSHYLMVKKGFWTNLETDEPIERNVGEMLALITSEISEALAAHRSDLNDDKVTHRKGIEVELVDAILRITDTAQGLGLDLAGALQDKMEFNLKRSDHKLENRKKEHGKKY